MLGRIQIPPELVLDCSAPIVDAESLSSRQQQAGPLIAPMIADSTDVDVDCSKDAAEDTVEAAAAAPCAMTTDSIQM